MSVWTTAIVSKMRNDTTLQGLIGTYTDDSANTVYAVFSEEAPGDEDHPDEIPGTFGGPYIVVQAPSSDVEHDSKTTNGREFIRDIVCFDENDGSIEDVEAVSERVRALFHKGSVTVTGYTQVDLRVINGPIVVNVPRNVVARLVTIRGIYQSN